MSQLFRSKQLSFTKVRSLNIKTVLFQLIHFSVGMHFSSIWLIDWTLSSATTLGVSGPGSDGNEGILLIPKPTALLKVHHQIV